MEHEELRFAGLGDVAKAVKRLTTGPAAQRGMVQRVLVTDGGDCACYEWRDGRVSYDGRELPE